MKFLKKLFETVLTLCIMAALAGMVWHFYGDYISSQVKYLLRTIDTLEEDSQYSEQTADMREILENAYTKFREQKLVACKTYNKYTGSEGAIGSYGDFAWDQEQDLVRKVLDQLDHTVTFIQGTYNPDTYLSDCFTRFDLTSGDMNTFELMDFMSIDEKVIHSVGPDTWYYHREAYNFSDFREGDFSANMPYALLRKLELKSYEEVGMEEFEGYQAVHYIVTHKPRLPYPSMVLEEQYDIVNEDGSLTRCSPLTYFETMIDPRVKENYPDFYASFLDLVEKRYYQDNQTHFWITEDGMLLGIEMEWTFEFYKGYLILDGFETVRKNLSVADSETGRRFYEEFAQLRPVTRVAVFQYGDEVEPVTIPEEYVSLAE